MSGGLLDQPFIWLLQWEIVDGVTKYYDALDEQAEKMKQGTPDLMAPLRIGRK